ncbi:MAG: response regulator [Gemmatimonadetes bacterium]|nr:response regulator [Gemmatimonadota bacterium]MCC7131035.1 response regulator [Gemmatimonadales bacterium]
MAIEGAERYIETLSTYVDALEAARTALSVDGTSATSIKRLAATLEGSSGRYGFPAVQAAAQAVRAAAAPDFAGAVDRLLYALLNAVAVPSSRQRTVLILDDDVVLARLYQRVLEKANRQVMVAQRAAEMLAIFRTQWVDLVILEIGLPDLDGREVLAALRKNPITAAIPVMVVTSDQAPWTESECQALGATRFFRKPVDPVDLAAAAGDLLAPRQVPPPTIGPVVTPPAAPPPEPTGPPPEPEVLLAEHDPLTSQIIRHRLGREGIKVRHFTSGTAALQAARSLTPSAVILDAMTPGIDGIELLTRLRELEHYRTIPILVLSDIGSEREVVRALEAGADDCIRKPFSPTELVARVERLLVRR